MLKYDNKEFRNLEEQVLKNKQDIARHYEIDRAMSNLGIKVVGQVITAEQLPDPLTYVGEYGDTYAVGDKYKVDNGIDSYYYYVFTRPDPNAGYVDNHWLNVGKISVVGPQGPRGPEGPQGKTGASTKWIVADLTNMQTNEGDIFLATNGDVYVARDNGSFELKMNIRGDQGLQGKQGIQGPQGIQGQKGAKGDRGDTGGLVNIKGKLTSADLLPTPESLNNPTAAYLVNGDLYIQIGETPATAVWENVGPLNVGTLVTTGGEYQNTWETDTKLDVYTPEEYATPTVYAANYFSGGNYQTQIPVDAEHRGPIVRYFDNPYGMGIVPEGYLRSLTFNDSALGADGCCVITAQNLMNWGLINTNGDYVGPGTTTSGNGPYYHSITVGMPDNEGVNITFNITNHVRSGYTFLGGTLPTDLLSIIPVNAPCIITNTDGGQRVGIIHSVNKSEPYEIKYKYSSEETIHTLDVTSSPTISTDVVTDIGMDPSTMT